jgi:hypothetical protein
LFQAPPRSVSGLASTPVEQGIAHSNALPLRFFLPTAEQTPNFGEHLPGVTLLAKTNVAEVMAEPQIKTQLV